MSIRFRKSIKLMPGVKVNVSKNSVGLSVGTKGARMSVNSKGKVYKSVGIPGTGLYSVEQSSINGSKQEDNIFVDENGEVFDESTTQVYAIPKKPLPQRTWFIILLLIFFWPVGIFLMWKYADWSKVAKIIVSVIVGILFIYSFFLM